MVNILKKYFEILPNSLFFDSSYKNGVMKITDTLMSFLFTPVDLKYFQGCETRVSKERIILPAPYLAINKLTILSKQEVCPALMEHCTYLALFPNWELLLLLTP